MLTEFAHLGAGGGEHIGRDLAACGADLGQRTGKALHGEASDMPRPGCESQSQRLGPGGSERKRLGLGIGVRRRCAHESAGRAAKGEGSVGGFSLQAGVCLGKCLQPSRHPRSKRGGQRRLAESPPQGGSRAVLTNERCQRLARRGEGLVCRCRSVGDDQHEGGVENVLTCQVLVERSVVLGGESAAQRGDNAEYGVSREGTVTCD